MTKLAARLTEASAAFVQRWRVRSATSKAQLFELLIRDVQEYAIIVLDPRGRIVGWNPGAERLKGYTEREVVGKSFKILYTPEAIEAGKPEQLLERARREGHADDEGWRVRKDGSRFWAAVSVTALRDPAGGLVGFAKITRDMTLRMRAEEAIRLREARFRSLLQAAPDAIAIVDREGRIVLVNTQTELMFGYTRDELIGKPVEKLMPERFREVHEAHRGHFYAYPHARPMGLGLDLYGRRKGGREFPVEISLAPLETREGNQVFATIRDVTQRRQLETAIKESEERYRRLVEVSPEAIVVDREGRLVFSNAAGARLFGAASAESLLGRPLANFVHPDDRAMYDERMRSAAKGESVPLFELRILREDATIVVVEMATTPIVLQNEHALIAIIRDITERKQAMLDAAQRRAELQQSEALNRLKDEFLSTLSHEMRTPLSLITGYAELLEDRFPNEGLIAGIQDGARRLGEHITQMLDYSALISGSMPLYEEEVCLNEVLENLAQALAPGLKLAGLKLETRVAQETPCIRGDAHRIGQMLNELIENARKFTGRGGTVGVEVAPARERWVRLDVWDTGPGIPQEELEHIWSAFTRLGAGDVMRVGGLGLGLAIVKELAHLHGGHVEATSTVGKGSRFSIFLPVAGRQEAQPKLRISRMPSSDAEKGAHADSCEPSA